MSTDTQHPNIVLILADDMGYSDIGCFGGEIATPNLDRMAANGLRMSSVYNCARCCPSRASLLTGLYPHQAGVGYMVKNEGRKGYQGYLAEDCATLAEVLRPAGYHTSYSGKWHSGGSWPRADGDSATWRFDDPTHPTPISRGFERFYGNLAGGGSYFNIHLAEQEQVVALPEGFYTTDHYTSKAIEYMDEARSQQRPFFVHLCYNAPHWPLHAWPEDIARYRGRYRQGWDAVRKARHERLKDLGILDRKWEISPRDAEARMAVYAAMVDRMDQNIGRILGHLERTGQLDNTLILFVSDNGGCAEGVGIGPRKMEVQSTTDGRPMRFGNDPAIEPGAPDTFMSYGLPWANASNSPFRRFKHWVHEGGISTPFVAHWPKAIAAGGLRHETAHFMDIAATIYDVAGAAYPSERNGQTLQPLEGQSFRPLLQGAPWQRSEPLFWEHEGNRAMREGPLKLVCRNPGTWELYDMESDRTELNDLAGRHPETTARMAGAYEAWALRCGVVPWAELRGK